MKKKDVLSVVGVVALLLISSGTFFVVSVESDREVEKAVLSDYEIEENSLEGYPFSDEYPSVEDLYQWFYDLEEEFSELMEIHYYGESHEERDLIAIEITSDEDTQVEEKSSILIDGALHAREWSSVQVSSYYMWRILEGYDTDETINWLVNNRRIFVIPMTNPDGYIYDGDGNLDEAASWRKNRNQDTPTNNVGVDLNRNWDISWEDGDSDPSSDTYRGEEPFSEKETSNLKGFIQEKDIDSYQNLHSHADTLLIPNMYTSEPSAHDDWYRDTADRMTSLTSKLGNENDQYSYGQPSEEIGYSASGGAADWAYHELGIQGFTYEIYTGGWSAGFYPPEEDIMAINEDLDDSLIYQTRIADIDLGDGNEELFPSTPYVVYGEVENQEGNSLSDITVEIVNQNTDEVLDIETNTNGYYELNLGNLDEYGYEEGDEFEVKADLEHQTDFIVDDSWGRRLDLEIDEEQEGPQSSFVYSPSEPVKNEEINFQDHSTGEIEEWSWDFGDGATSTEQHPTHSYDEEGIYTVELTVKDENDLLDTTSKNIEVEEEQIEPPQADFDFTPEQPKEDEQVDFSDQSMEGDATVDIWEWNFGDGSTSNEQNPTHAYEEEGAYTVELTVEDENNLLDTKTTEIEVNQEDEYETYTATNSDHEEAGRAYSEGWWFPEYYAVGSEDHLGDSDDISTLKEIEAGEHYELVEEDEDPEGPEADFSYSPTEPEEGEEIEFSDQSTEGDGDIVEWSWEFGDGTTSDEQNPIHAYEEEGVYTVELTVTDRNDLSDTVSQQIETEDEEEDDDYETYTATNSDHEDAGRAYSEGWWFPEYYAEGSEDYLGDSDDITTLKEIESGEYYELIEEDDGDDGEKEYCEVEGGDTSYDEYITNVKFNGIDVSSGDNGGYADHTDSVSDPVKPGETYELSVTMSTGGYEDYVSVAFDWNQDYDLSNNEVIEVGYGSNDPETVTTEITIPLDAETGELRMRVMQEYNAFHTEPCEDQSYGETQDFTVKVSDSSEKSTQVEMEQGKMDIKELFDLDNIHTKIEILR